jgi:hypothetical protein
MGWSFNGGNCQMLTLGKLRFYEARSLVYEAASETPESGIG